MASTSSMASECDRATASSCESYRSAESGSVCVSSVELLSVDKPINPFSAVRIGAGALLAALLAGAFTLAALTAPTQRQICHRLNLTDSTGRLCVPDLPGEPVCPAQRTECEVLTESAWMVQGSAGVAIAFVMLFLWLVEVPRRSKTQYVADNSKSVLLACFSHFFVLGLSAVLGDVTVPHCARANATAAASMHGGAQPCDWYILTFVLDCMLGVPFTILAYTGTARAFRGVPCLEPLSRIGDYEAAPDPASGERAESSRLARVERWAAQVVHWLLSALVSRTVEAAAVVGLIEPLMAVANRVGWWACTPHQVAWKQWLNMMFYPIVLDAVQFTVQNYVLRAA